MAPPQDISDTLDALERKLRDLEAELGTPAGPPPVAEAPPTSAGGGLDDLARQIDDLGRFREHLHKIGRELEEEYAKVLARLDLEPAPAAVEVAEPEPVAVVEAAEPEPPADEPAATTVDAGPFADLDALGAFEAALQAIDGVTSAEVTGFEGRRALIAVRAGAGVALEHALRTAAPLSIARVVAEPGRLVVDLGAAGQ